MTHPLATHRSLRNVASVVATLLGQAFADGPDRAPILPKTHAAPAPSWPSRELAGALPSDDALLAAFTSYEPAGSPPADWHELGQRVHALLRGDLGDGPGGVHPDGHGTPHEPADAPTRRSP